MKKYLIEILILSLQFFMFYIFPLFAGPTDIMGMVILIIFSVFILSFIFGIISNFKIKYIYPFMISFIFFPTIFIYYNKSALVYVLWYFVLSFIGIIIGSLIKKIFNIKK